LIDLVNKGFGQTVGGNEFGALPMKQRQAGKACGVDRGHLREIYAEDSFMLVSCDTSPAVLQYRHLLPAELSFELESECFRLVVNRDAEHFVVPAFGVTRLKQGPCRWRHVQAIRLLRKEAMVTCGFFGIETTGESNAKCHR
jgi:hypothetical protein